MITLNRIVSADVYFEEIIQNGKATVVSSMIQQILVKEPYIFDRGAVVELTSEAYPDPQVINEPILQVKVTLKIYPTKPN
jgi:hypothetical protein